jgi:Ca-activated chloride channel family protein
MRKAAFFAFLVVLFLLPADGPAATPSEPSRKQRIAALPEEERKWLTEFVEPIILPDEEKLFLELTQPHHREMFKKEFWERREREGLAAPLGPGYRQRYEHLRDVAATQYDGLTSDAGRLVVRRGEPAAIDTLETCDGVLTQVEVWTYRGSAGRPTQHVFYRPGYGSQRKLWSPGLGDAALIQPAACVISLQELCLPQGVAASGAANPGDSPCSQPGVGSKRCGETGCRFARIAEDIRSRHGDTIAELAQLSKPPAVSTEGLDLLRQRLASVPNNEAKSIGVSNTGVVVPAANVQTSAPAKELSKKDRLAAMPEEDRKWLTEYVAPIIQPEEEALFLKLTEPHQREIFKEAFWARREKLSLLPPLGAGYRHRYEELRRIADEKYDGWRNDAGRMVIAHGEPVEIEELAYCGDSVRDLEIWKYANLGGSGRGRSEYLFYRPSLGAPRKLWYVGVSEDQLYTPFAHPLSGQEQILECVPGVLKPLDPRLPHPNHDCICRLFAFMQQAKALTTAASGAMEAGRALAPEKISTEDLSQLESSIVNLSKEGARPVGVANTGVVPAANVQTSAAPAKELSKKERLAAMPEDDRKWLTEYVAPIIQPEEEALYLQLTEPHQREIFKEAFWARREKENLQMPLGPGYRRRYEELRRLADEKYDGWRNDAGRMVLRWGEPAAIEEAKACSPTSFRGLEIWTYTNRTGMNRATEHWLFYRPMALAPRKLWTMGTRDGEIFEPNSCRKTFPELYADCTPQIADRCGGGCPTQCDVYNVWTEVSARQGSEGGAQIELARMLAPAKVSTEDLAQVSDKFPGLPTKGAKSLTVEGPSSTTPAAAAKPAATQAASTPAPTHRKLSRKEVKELSDQLPAKYKEFLELVDLIITDQEREVFLQITDNYQKDRFIESFWRRRSVDSSGIRTDYQAVHTHRVQIAKEQFKHLNSERSKMLIINGPPDAVIAIDCPEVYVPIQIWYYDRLEAVKSKAYLIFYTPYGVGPEYKLWLPLDGEGVLQVGGGIGSAGGMRQPGSRRVDYDRCPETRTLRQAIAYTSAVLGSGASALAGAGKLFQPPVIETEGVDQILTMTTELATGSAPLGVVKLVRFPEMRANKIGVDLSLMVAKSDLKPRDLGEEKFYNVDVIGEVVKGERLIDNFKYRFDIPTQEVGSEKIPLTVRRYLYPGEYNIVLKVSDGNQSAEGRITDKLTVPEQPDAPPPDVLAKRADASATIEKARDLGLLPSAIMLLPVAKEIVTGLQRFETRAAENVKAVDFYLNGSKMMTKTRPPFAADLNLGPLPRKHTIRVVAFGTAGRAVGEDEYTVNEGREIFRVRILSPEKGSKASGPTKVVAAVVVPEGKTLQKMEFYSNERRVATLYQPPFEQTVNIAEAKSLGYVRVVGTLEDGAVSEDLRYVNAPAYISEVSVDAVELYTTVSDKGRPVQGLQASNFKVFEDGVIQKVESFEYVKNLPLTLGVIIDTSASMLESLPEAQAAALSFLEFSIGEKDRAFTVSFDNEPYLLTKLTSRKDRLVRSLAGLRAEGSTALYDAIIYGLYQFTGVKGKKALVVLSDGKDTASKFDYETLVEYVKKAGISIYGIGLKISGADLEVKYKLNKLAQATGGQTFYVDSAKNLEAVYRQINDDLRSQYLLTYYSTNATGKDKWRKVEIKVEPTSLQARTITGYYP